MTLGTREVATSGTTALSTMLLPSIGNMVFVAVLFVLIFSSGQGLLADGDTGYHIRTGEVILQTGQVPTQDIYSFHSPTLPWTAHEWLSEVVMATIFRVGGLTGVVIFFAFVFAFTHWLLYRMLRTDSDDIVLATAITLLATATSSSHWLARPHAFSLLLTVVWYRCLDRYQQNSARTLVWLPLLMLLWVNLHGGFFFGLVLLTIYLAGNCFYSLSGPPETIAQHRRKAKSFFLVLVASVGVCAINPYGFEILMFPLRVTSDRFVMDRVTEFMSPNFHEALPFKYMLLTVIGVFALSRSALNIVGVGLVVLTSYMALYSGRHVSLFAIVTAPLLLKTGQSLISALPGPILSIYQKRNHNLSTIDAKLKGHFWPVFASSLVVSLALIGLVRFQFSDERFPVKATEFLKEEFIPGRMFNNDEFGDYMIFSLWPDYRVFMDGRSDMYGEKFGSDYLKIANVQPGWRDILKKYDITWVVFDTQSALAAALQEDVDWQPIYSDKVATIFIKRNSAHERLLTKYTAVTVQSR